MRQAACECAKGGRAGGADCRGAVQPVLHTPADLQRHCALSEWLGLMLGLGLAAAWADGADAAGAGAGCCLHCDWEGQLQGHTTWGTCSCHVSCSLFRLVHDACCGPVVALQHPFVPDDVAILHTMSKMWQQSPEAASLAHAASGTAAAGAVAAVTAAATAGPALVGQ